MAAIVKLTLLKYPIKEITKILKVSRMLAWKWAHFENYEATGKRKTKLDYNEQQFLLKKTEGKIVGIDAPSSRELKKEFFEEYNKNISHTTINNFLNKSAMFFFFQFFFFHKLKKFNLKKGLKYY